MPVAMTKSGDKVNGWNIGRENMGTYGTSYLRRANIALGGLGANLPEDAVYPVAFIDGDGNTLTGANKYVLHFDKGQTPPANAFWSVTMYDQDGFQVPNPINRFAIGDRDKLTFNPDGSLDIYVQADSPGQRQGSKLASRAEGRVSAHHAHLFATSQSVGWFMVTTTLQARRGHWHRRRTLTKSALSSGQPLLAQSGHGNHAPRCLLLTQGDFWFPLWEGAVFEATWIA